MKKLNIICILLITILFTHCGYKVVTTDDIKNLSDECAELGYFSGQKDALNGDIRIKLNEDSVYIWTKSCWNSGKTPIFAPTYLDTKK